MTENLCTFDQKNVCQRGKSMLLVRDDEPQISEKEAIYRLYILIFIALWSMRTNTCTEKGFFFGSSINKWCNHY